MKLSDVLRIVNPDYVYIRLKPNNSVRNQNTHLVARAIASLHRSIWQSVKREEGKAHRLLPSIRFERPTKVAYYIYIEKRKVEFYFIAPRQYASVIREKLGDVWSGLTLEEVPELPVFSDKATKQQMVYEKEDALSLRTDRRDNDLLNNTLNVIDVMEEGDKVGVLYNFIPSSQRSFAHSYKATSEKIKKGLPVERNKIGAAYALKMALAIVDNLLSDLVSIIAGKGNKSNKGEEMRLLDGLIDRLNGGRKVKESTERKANATILDTQILIMSESADPLRQRNNAVSVVQSYDSVTDDNRLIGKPFRGKINFHSRTIPGVEVNRVSDLEAQHFIGLAGREILERFPSIERIETQETEVPEDLQEGVLCVGESVFRGFKQAAYLSNDREYRNLLTLLIGPTRAGKTTLIGNLANDAIRAGECVLIFDFIENCELSSEVARLFPKEKVLNIVCDNPKSLQGLGYNEASGSDDPFLQYKHAKDQTSNLETLINTLNPDPLSSKMARYLESASLVAFISGGSIGDVFSVLQNHKARHEFINRVPREHMEYLGDHIDGLTELDEKDKHSNPTGGTNFNLIAGIIDRLNALKRNPYVEMMLKKDTSNNINLVDEIQRNQLICIRMPQSMFTTDGERDIYTTYWITKLWLALQVRADRIRDKSQRVKLNLVIDELYQVSNTEKFLTSKLSQIAKFICKPIISCHYINQLKYMRDELRSANTSYMLIAGCDAANYRELKEELYPFTAEDLKNLKRYHSLNYLKCKEGYSRFITKLPAPLS